MKPVGKEASLLAAPRFDLFLQKHKLLCLLRLSPSVSRDCSCEAAQVRELQGVLQTLVLLAFSHDFSTTGTAAG